MFRRTLLGFVAVMGLLAVGSGTAMAEHRSFSSGHHHHYHGGYVNQGYGGYRTPNYGYGGYSPYVVAQPQFVPSYGCNNGYSGYGYGPAYGGYGAYGYGAPYRSGVSYSNPGFGLYIGR